MPPQPISISRNKQWKLKAEQHRRWSRRWLILAWGTALGCWMWYHAAEIPIWLSAYGGHRENQSVLLDDAREFRQGLEIATADSLLSVEDAETILEQGDREVVLENREDVLENRSQGAEWVVPEEQPRMMNSSRTCATVEEMGAIATGRNTMSVDLNLRKMIQEYFSEHGARRVRALPAKDFCRRNFVYGRANEDGFGNEMYKILSAAGLALMLNRSLIIGEDSSQNPAYLGRSKKIHRPFGEYVSYSDESFSMSEVKHLWVTHGCARKYKRHLKLRVDSILRPSATNALCGDWTDWPQPIIWFFGAQDAVALQIFLKNVHPSMNSAATRILGDPTVPSSRGNLYGELMHAFISPKPDIVDAVEWTLGGGADPDISLHLRMLHSRSRRAIETSCACLKKIIYRLGLSRLPRVAIVTDTPSVVDHIRTSLETFAEVVYFDYKIYLNSSRNVSDVMKENYFQPPRRRVDDWGPSPRWVALVDFFVASRAKHGVVSAGSKRVATTYAQLVASMAAANSLEDEHRRTQDFVFYSSFHAALVARGLSLQRGWGHAWRTFSGGFSCVNQAPQCALTPLLPYAWWDLPLQLPTSRDARIMRTFGIQLDPSSGNVSVNKFCRSRKTESASITRLALPV